MALCDSCHVEETKWLDFRGRTNLGIRIQIVGTGSHTIPTHRTTAETVYGAIREIRKTCAEQHQKGA